MSSTTEPADLLADCRRLGIAVTPTADGTLSVDAPSGALTPELVESLKANKTELLAVLTDEEWWRDLYPPGAWPAVGTTPRSPQQAGACPRCGSSQQVETTVHDGRTIRRDCGQCGKFLCFAVWYGQASTTRCPDVTRPRSGGGPP